jgi:hypothetical protein
MENVGKFYDHFEKFTALGMFYAHLVQFVVSWYIFTVLVCLDHVKFGNPAHGSLVGRR